MVLRARPHLIPTRGRRSSTARVICEEESEGRHNQTEGNQNKQTNKGWRIRRTEVSRETGNPGKDPRRRAASGPTCLPRRSFEGRRDNLGVTTRENRGGRTRCKREERRRVRAACRLCAAFNPEFFEVGSPARCRPLPRPRTFLRGGSRNGCRGRGASARSARSCQPFLAPAKHTHTHTHKHTTSSHG